jgi:hypothetical protein
MWGNGWGLSRIDKVTWLVLLGSFAVHFSPPNWLEEARRRFAVLPAYAQGAVLSVVAVAMAAIAETDVVPFIYFQF